MRTHRRDAALRFRRLATPVATARVHHAIRVYEFDCAHGWQPRPFGGQNGMAAAAWRQVSVDFAYRLERPDTECHRRAGDHPWWTRQTCPLPATPTTTH